MITIPLNPVTKKNSQRIVTNNKSKKPIIIPSKAYKQYEKDAKWFLSPLGIDVPVNIKCLFYMKTHTKVDLVNLLEAIDDIMVDAGTLIDDNCEIVAGHDGSRVYYDKENPRTEIYFEEIE